MTSGSLQNPRAWLVLKCIHYYIDGHKKTQEQKPTEIDDD